MSEYDRSNAKTDPAPAYDLQSIGGMLADIQSKLEQNAKDQEVLFGQVFTRLGELEAVKEMYGRVIVRLDTVQTCLDRIEYSFEELKGEIADALSKTVPIGKLTELEARIIKLEELLGAVEHVDETQGQADREVGAGR